MEITGFGFCYGKIVLDLLWKMDGGGWSMAELEADRPVIKLW